MNNALRILAGLLDLLATYGKRKEQKGAQAEADRINDDPADWYRDHFRVRPGDTGTSSAEASKADP